MVYFYFCEVGSESADFEFWLLVGAEVVLSEEVIGLVG